ncbi:MAG: hypothetical protein WKI04_06975 [Ferruginibacter sp.]
MKIRLIVAMIVLCTNAVAQKTEVLSDSSKTKTAIFNRTLFWIEKIWGTNADKVIESRDEVAGTILVRGGLKAAPKSDEGFAVKGQSITELTIQVENGRAKLNFQATTFKWDAGTVWNFGDDNGGTQKAKWKAEVAIEIDELIENYKVDFNK